MALKPNELFIGKITDPSAAYPLGSARNVTTPGDGTGTPLVAALLNDIFGFQQSLLAAAGITANGDPDSVTNPQYKNAILALLSKRVVPFGTLANAVASTDASLVFNGAVLKIKDRANGIFDVVLASGVTANTFNIIACTGFNTLALQLRLTSVIDAAAVGAKLDNSTDDLLAMRAAHSICLSTFASLTWKGTPYVSDNLSLRFISITAPLGNVRVADNKMLILGGDASSPENPNQEIRKTFRSGDDSTVPTCQIRGAKGCKITIRGQTNFVQLYADTNSDVEPTDYSIAYNHFSMLRVIKLELTNNPSSDGSSVQWINENRFDLKRTNIILINGTYEHNHNVFNTPNIEASSSVVINIEKGSSNLFYDARLEGVSGAEINFSAGTWGNYIYATWMEHPNNRMGKSNPSNVTITDAGNNNAVIYDYNQQLLKIPLISVSGSMQNGNNRDDGLALSPSLGGIYPVTNSNSSLAKTLLIPVFKNTVINCSSGGKYRAVVACFDSSRKKIDDLSNTDIASPVLTSFNGNKVSVNTGVSGWVIYVAASRVAYIEVDITASFNQTFTDFGFNISVNAMYSPENQYQQLPNSSDFSAYNKEVILVTSKPTKVVARAGTIFTDSTNTWTVIKQVITQSDGGASSGDSTIVADSVAGMAVNDIIGILKNNGFTFWTTISAINSQTITLNDALDADVTDGMIQTIRLST